MPAGRWLRGLVLFGAAALLLTEILSLFHWIRRAPLAAAWIMVLGVAAFLLLKASRGGKRPRFSIRPEELAVIAVILAIAAAVGYTAILYPPNSADAMAYHMPRVVYWAQAGSVAFFPTPYFNQISLPPL